MKHFSEFWWIYTGLLGSAACIWHLLKRRGGDEPVLRRLIFAAYPQHDPKSPKYDPGLAGRQLLLVLAGLCLVGLVNVVLWISS